MATKGETVEIATPFRIGRYPVTNGQYQAFIDDGGYRERRWWSDAGWTWLQEKKVTEPLVLARPALERSQPAGGGRQLLGGRGVLRLGRRAAAARRRNGRPPPAARKATSTPGATTGRTGFAIPARRASASPRRSGCFPAPAKRNWASRISPGNVWEWCGSLYNLSDKDPNAAVCCAAGPGTAARTSRAQPAASRAAAEIAPRTSFIGFRVACSSPTDEH